MGVSSERMRRPKGRQGKDSRLSLKKPSVERKIVMGRRRLRDWLLWIFVGRTRCGEFLQLLYLFALGVGIVWVPF